MQTPQNSGGGTSPPSAPSAHPSAPPPSGSTGTGTLLRLAAMGIALWLFFRYAWGIFLPFLLAWGLSCAVRPLVDGICRRVKLPRGACAAGLVILITGSVTALAVSGLRRGTRELATLAEELAADSDRLVEAVNSLLAKVSSLSAHIPFLRRLEGAAGYGELSAKLDSLVEAGAARLAEAVTARLPSAAMAVAGWLPSAFIFLTVTLLSCYYFSADSGRIAASLSAAAVRLTPEGLRDRLPPLGRRLRRLGRRYLRACLLLGLLTFLQMFIGLAILRVPYAFILAFLIALVDYLPLLGTGVVLIPWAAVCLLWGKLRLGIGLLILYGVTTLIRQVLEPKLIGEGLGLHPLLSLLSMYAGLRLFGVWGMILAPLVAAGVKSVAAD